MVLIAIVVSRAEAVVLASMLQAAGIIVHTGALYHANTEVISLALGHYRLTVPESQYRDASRIVADTFARSEFRFSKGLQAAVIKLLLAWIGSSSLFLALGVAAQGPSSLFYMLLAPLYTLTFPVNPQGRSDYFLNLGERD